MIEIISEEPLSSVIEKVQKLSVREHLAILLEHRIEPTPGLEPERHAEIAMSFAQQAWYGQAVKDGRWPPIPHDGITTGPDEPLVETPFGRVPEKINKEHEARIARYREAKPTITGDLPILPQGKRPTLARFENQPAVIVDGHYVFIFLVRPRGLARTVEEVRKRPDPALYRAILVFAGYKVQDDDPLDLIYPLVAGVVNSWWYELALQHGVTDLEGRPDPREVSVPETQEHDQRLRYARYLRGGKRVVAPKARTPKEPKPAKELKPPKVAKEKVESPKVKVPKVKGPLAFGLTENAPMAGTLGTGSLGQVYDAVVALARPSAPIEDVIRYAVEKGFTTKEPAGPGPRITWLAKELVKKGVLYLAGEQTEIPGTPVALPKENA